MHLAQQEKRSNLVEYRFMLWYNWYICLLKKIQNQSKKTSGTDIQPKPQDSLIALIEDEEDEKAAEFQLHDFSAHSSGKDKQQTQQNLCKRPS